MVSGLDSGSRPGWISVLCCVLGQNTQFSLIVPLFTQEYKWVAGELLGRSDKMLGKGGGGGYRLLKDQHPTQGGINDTPSRFMLRKPAGWTTWLK